MKRTPLALLACVLVLASAACGKASSAAAATVNGKAISTQALVDELNAINGNKDYLAALNSAFGQRGQKVSGSAPGSFDLTFASTTLQQQIYFRLLRDEAVKDHLKPDAACKDAAQQEVYTELGPASPQQGGQTGKATFEAFDKHYQATLLQRFTDLLLVQGHLANQPCVAKDAARAYFDAHRSEFEQACASVIVVADKAAADSAKARLAGGESFASVAAALSLDPSKAQGGDVGCKAQSELSREAIPAFFGTAVGHVSDPVALSSGFVIVQVTSRKEAQYETVQQQASELAAQQASTAFQAFIRQAASSAKVTVDARYGTWNSDSGHIDPPPSASTTSSTPTRSSIPPVSTTTTAPATPPSS